MADLALHGGPAAADIDVPEWPQLTDTARENVLECLEGERWCRLYEGSWAERFEEAYGDYHDAEHAIAVSNGTVALELALRTLGVQPGDEVLVPSYTFIATASAVACCGAVPRFVDVDPDTFNIDPESLANAITEDTVGVIGVHFHGYPFDVDRVRSIVREHDLFLVEDASHAQGSEWRDEKVGALGDMGTFSFQETKSLSGGDGGIVLTDDDLLAERARLLHNIGRAEGEPGYKHYVLSSNYRLPELVAAHLLGQLEALPAENERRRAGEAALRGRLEAIEGISLKPADDRITARGYVGFGFRYDPGQFAGTSRDRLVEALRAEGVPCGTGYAMPLYDQPAFSREEVGRLLPPGTEIPNYRALHQPGVEELCRTGLRLGHATLLADETELRTIGDAIEKVRANADAL